MLVAVSENVSFGVDGRFRREQVSETLYRIGLRNGVSFPLVDRQAFTRSSWDFDAGMSWRPYRWSDGEWSRKEPGRAYVGANLVRRAPTMSFRIQ